MSGDFIGVTKGKYNKDTVDGLGGRTPTQPQGKISSIFFNDSLEGMPRNDNLFAVRLLGQTPQIEWLKDIIKQQVASTEFHVKPEEEDADEQVLQAAENIENFLEGNFNTDNQSFDDLLKIILDDVLDFNSGIIEKVPDSNGYIRQLITRDGLTFTKNVMDNGLLPPPDSGEPAYYQFSASSYTSLLSRQNGRGLDFRNIRSQLGELQQFNRITSRESIPFSRDQIVWFSDSPTSYDPYGRGKTQKVRKAAEIMLNGDAHRNRFFIDNEFHKGVLSVDSSLSQDDKKNLKKRFKQSAGNEYELPIVGSSENIEYISIDPEPEKMQFLESQKWYTKLVIMAYGLNEAEAGLHENANLAVSEEMKFNVWRRTTQPLLEMIERKFNNEILPFLQPYDQVDGKVEFEFQPQNKFLERIETELITDKLENNTTTLNEARQELGKEGFGELGDLPLTAFKEYARNNPSFVVENLTDIEDAPSGDGGGTSPFENFNVNLEEARKNYGDDTGKLEANSSRQNGQEKDKENKKREDGSGRTDSSLNITSYEEAFENKDKVLEHTKEALRNQRGFDDVEGIVGHKDEMKSDVAQVFNSINLDQALEKEFPEDDVENGVLVDVDKIVDQISFRDRLGSVLETNNLGALEMSAEHHEKDIEQETEQRFNLPDETKIEISFDVLNTFTADIIRNEALSSATEIESTIKDRVRNALLKGAEKGEGINKIKDRIKDVQDSFTDDHAELVARTETLQSSRKGSQALAEATDLVAGKEWLATNDSRTREWHKVMDGQIVDKDSVFTVPQTSSDKQPSNYPRTARVVGEDQPFNCRCSQAPVISEDMPDSVQQLDADFDNVNVDLGMSKRQFEVWKENNNGESSFEEFWKNANENMSKTEIAKQFNMSKTTVYGWD